MPAAKKDSSVRARRNTASTASTLARPTSKREIPALPILDAGAEWHDNALEWWRAVWSSPMATEFVEVDQHALELLAVLINDFWYAPDPISRKFAATEIRLQRKDFGLTPYDRRRLEWTIEEADAATDRGRARRERQGVKQSSGATDPRRGLHAV